MTFLTQMKINNYALVFLGGGLGALTRYLITVLTEEQLGSAIASSLPLYIANISGASLLGIINASNSEKTRTFWGAGFAGGYTTMSGVALFLYTLSPLMVLQTATLMFGLGFIAYAAGSNLARVLRKSN